MGTKTHKYEELWQDPENWRFYVFYVCREDPRIIVPKRFRVTGWTLNFAHRQAFLFFLTLLAVIIIPLVIVEITDLDEINWVRPAAITVSVLAVLVLTWWAGRRQKD